MCLATVYKAQEPETKLFEFVSRIDVDGETITLTDVMRTESCGGFDPYGGSCQQHCEDQLF